METPRRIGEYDTVDKGIPLQKQLTTHEIAVQNEVNQKIAQSRKWVFSKKGEPKKPDKLERSVQLLSNTEGWLSDDKELSLELKVQLLKSVSNAKEEITRIRAGITLQKYIRGKRVQENAVMPQEIRSAWAVIPALAQMDTVKQTDFSQILAQELQIALADPDLHGKELYFSKDDPNNKRIPPWSFYIKVDPKLQIAVISINQAKKAKGILGKGSYKTVYKGYELKIPLKIDINGRLIAESNKAVARPKDPKSFNEELLVPNQIHREIYNSMKAENLPGHLTEPPTLREHSKRGRVKQELIQNRYPSDLGRLITEGKYKSMTATHSNPVNYETRLSLIEALFETTDSLSRLGVSHRDIKPENVLLGEENDVLYPYIHDFDLVIKDSALGLSSTYFYWDAAGQIGLVSHASDIVGSMLTACEFLYTLPFKFLQDSTHSFFKNGDKIAISKFIGISPRFNQLLNANPGDPLLATLNDDEKKLLAKKRADIKILQAFCKVFEKEEQWKNQLLGSCICHFANLSADDYAKLQLTDVYSIKQKMIIGVEKWTKDRLLESGGEKLLKVFNITKDEFLKQDVKALLDDLAALKNAGLLKDSLTLEEIRKFDLLDQQYNSLIVIAYKLFPNTADPELFSLLNSNNPEERKKGLDIGFKTFGRAGDLKQEIHRIREEYLAEVQQSKSANII